MPRHRSRWSRGVVLPVALVLLALLAALAMVFTNRTQVESLVLRNGAQAIQARALAQAGVYWATGRLLKNRGEISSFVYEDAADLEFGGGRISVLTTNETGKVDLNAAPDPLMRNLLQVAGADEARLDALVDAIADWRDQDDLTRLNGAEAQRYAAEDLSYGPQNRPFLRIEELDQVLGLDRDTLRRLLPLVTVWSAQAKIYPAAAPEAVLMAIPQIDLAQVGAYVEARDGATGEAAGGPLPALAIADQWLATLAGPHYRIVAMAQTPQGVAAVVEAVVRIEGDRGEGHEILAIFDSDASAAFWIDEARAGERAQ